MTNKTIQHPRNIMLLAVAIAGLCALAFVRSAAAQYSAGQDGHAHDANNRVGSGGQNSSGHPNGTYTHPFDISNRAVIGGGIYRDPRFATPLSGPTTFNPGTIGNGLGTPTSIVGGLDTPGYAQGIQMRASDRDALLLSGPLNSGLYEALDPALYQTGRLNVAPVYGIHTVTNGIDNFTLPGDRLGIDSPIILRMRQELRDSSQTNPSAVQPTQSPEQPIGLNPALNRPLGQPSNAPIAPTLGSPVPNTAIGNTPLTNTGLTSPTIVGRASLIPPEQQSNLLNILQKRMESTSAEGKALMEAKAARAQATQTPAPNPNNAQSTGHTDLAPVRVKTLAAGITAKGLHDLLAGAEDLIRKGSYDLAIAQYNQCQRIVPNNPLVQLGRAHAELAGGYYAQAELDLRVAFRANPELLLLQFDLAALLPAGRIDFVRKDLQGLAQTDAKSERPWFILAYLDYNTDRPADAEKDLTEAEKRFPRDVTLARMRQFWALPSNANPAPAIPPLRTKPAAPKTPAAQPAPAPALNK